MDKEELALFAMIWSGLVFIAISVSAFAVWEISNTLFRALIALGVIHLIARYIYEKEKL